MRVRHLLFLLFAMLASTTVKAFDFGVGLLVYNISNDKTSYIQNPNFEDNISGWTVEVKNANHNGWQDDSYSTTETGVSISGFAEAWRPDGEGRLGEGSISQTILNLPAGKYVLDADIIAVWQGSGETTVTGVQLFAGDNGKDVTSLANEKPVHSSLSFTHSGGSLTIGLRTQEGTTANWIGIDNVTLATIGVPEVEVACYSVEATANSNYYTGSIIVPQQVTHDGVLYTVTAIGDNAFANCGNLTSMSVPATVTRIGRNAFKECSSLNSVNIPEGVTAIQDYTFYNCNVLPSVTIPSTITYIGNYAFYGCNSLQSMTLPDIVSSIGAHAFQGCSSMDSINIPQGLTALQQETFSGCSSITSIVLPESMQHFGMSTFFGCTNLESINIPYGVSLLDGSLFNGCNNLASVVIPETVTTIEWAAFCNCWSLGSLVLPESVTFIGRNVFDWCGNLKLYSSNPTPPAIDGDFMIGTTPTIAVPIDYVDAYKAAEGWKDFMDNIVASVVGTYNVVWNNKVVASADRVVLAGEVTPARPEELDNDYLTLTLDGALPETLNENTTINYTAEWTGPFQFSDIEEDVIWWYNLRLNNTQYMNTASTEPYPTKANATLSEQSDPSYQWAFVGNPYAVVLYNGEGGFEKSLTPANGIKDDSPVVLREGTFEWNPVKWNDKLLLQAKDKSYTGFLNVSGGKGSLVLWHEKDQNDKIDVSIAPSRKVVSVKKGDVNEDGEVNVSDVTSLVNIILNQ